MRPDLAARGAAAALAFGVLASGCGEGGAPSPSPVAEPDADAPAETAAAPVAAISMPELLSSFSGRYADAEEVGFPTRIGCLLRPGDRYDYRTSLSITLRQTEDLARPDEVTTTRLDMDLESVVEVVAPEDSEASAALVVVYTSRITGLDTDDPSASGLSAADLPVVTSRFPAMGSECIASHPQPEPQEGPDLTEIMSDLGMRFAADQIAVPPPLRYGFPPIDIDLSGPRGHWTLPRRPSRPNIAGWPGEQRLPALEIGFETSGFEEGPSGQILTAGYETVTPASLVVNVAEQQRGDQIDQDAEWMVLQSYKDGRLRGEAGFLVAPAPGGRIQAVPSRIDETYTASVELTRRTPQAAGALVDTPSQDLRAAADWVVEATTVMVGMRAADDDE